MSIWNFDPQIGTKVSIYVRIFSLISLQAMAIWVTCSFLASRQIVCLQNDWSAMSMDDL